ncbi:YraN family protein [Microbacterium sp. NIBRBAC000506063]|uniref:YraN family protein n=1 Tax=Microbacterium sp. NIBRBAC000506063 TaxID=2734618 RepID=UPI001BB748E6|nr:YraN family protein [Microbacterium sp. NIBRBAC000506063]QTV79670.1 YraN family protein [Microbacterium sp. NIBRBAC000506063]
MAAKDELGRAGEQRAAEHLTTLGYEILGRNWRCPQGEIDIIARRGRELAVVEVKTRRALGFGHPFEAIDARKRERLWRLAYAWAAEHPDLARGGEIRLHAIAIVGVHPEKGALEHLADLR